MCQAKTITSAEPRINGRHVLHPNCNQVASFLDRRVSLNKAPKKSPIASPPVSPKQSPVLAKPTSINATNTVKKPKKSIEASSLIVDVASPGSIAAARREQVAIAQVQRKSKIAHYGRAKPVKSDQALDSSLTESLVVVEREQKRCSYITATSELIYVAYHDEEWGVPVHDDKLLFELLVLTGAQVGSDWTSILKKREMFRDVFSGFEAEAVAKYNEKKIVSISAEYGIELGLIRGAVDNANRILEVKKGFGTFAEYLWGFVNHKPISNQYKHRQKIPVKTSKSEAISKDMVRRGFRFVGPTTIHSFMQAAGFTNDHLTTCPRHLQCTALAS